MLAECTLWNENSAFTTAFLPLSYELNLTSFLLLFKLRAETEIHFIEGELNFGLASAVA